jgi:hypothetical protein
MSVILSLLNSDDELMLISGNLDTLNDLAVINAVWDEATPSPAIVTEVQP